MSPIQGNCCLLRVQHVLCVRENNGKYLCKKMSKSVKSSKYMDDFFSRMMTSLYLKVASYIYLQNINPSTVVKYKQSSRGALQKRCS